MIPPWVYLACLNGMRTIYKFIVDIIPAKVIKSQGEIPEKIIKYEYKNGPAPLDMPDAARNCLLMGETAESDF